MNRKLCVVFGGTGFIGRHLVAKLRINYDVRVISRKPLHSTSPNLTYRQVHLSDFNQLSDCVEGADIVYQLATGTGTTWADYQRDFIEATCAIGEACLKANVSRLVYVSSISALYLGANRQVDESDATDPFPWRRNLYSRAKILTERALRDLQRRNNLPLVIARPGIVMGQGGPHAHSGLGYWPNDLHCLSWGWKLRPLPLVLVSDLTQALLRCGSQPGLDGKAFNIVGDFRPTAQEFLDRLGIHTHRRFTLHRRSIAGIYNWSYFKFLIKKTAGRSAQVPTLRDLRSRTFASNLSNSLAKAQLNWRPVADPEIFYREIWGPQSQCGSCD